ncbi:MAG: Phenylacetic acid catabolic protein [Planctomycetota bacterium]|jgi:1,2-phenylacetyl-CoA epoxidase catalytic subunit
MSTTVNKTYIPKKFHEAVVKWQEMFIPDYPFLIENWKGYFPHQPTFELCAFHDCSVCPNIEVGQDEGKPKFTSATEMNKEQADHLLKAVKAQASTELGSIQQHRKTLARASNEQDQFWILRMMAEELRHGYQMFSVLLSDDWQSVTDTSGEDMVEEVLSMRTGNHVLGAFNIDFDSFLDNITFCAVIDRVGKYQLDMQKVSSYKPMSESMPPMLREEAFHLATGVTPLRRWAEDAARDEGMISMKMIQEALYKWIPRGLDMFGDERGGGRNVEFGFKYMKNGEAMHQYLEECRGIIEDMNIRHLRVRFPELSRQEAQDIVTKIVNDGEAYEGIQREDLLHAPDHKFFRRRGPHAFTAYDTEGNEKMWGREYLDYMHATLPDSYVIGRDFQAFIDGMDKIAAGEWTPVDAVRSRRANGPPWTPCAPCRP